MEFKQKCPHCYRVIRGRNESIFYLNMAQHIAAKHEGVMPEEWTEMLKKAGTTQSKKPS